MVRKSVKIQSDEIIIANKGSQNDNKTYFRRIAKQTGIEGNNVIATLDGVSTTDVLQLIQIEDDNFNDFCIKVEGIAEKTTIDTFDSVADWSSSDNNNSKVELDNTFFQEGTGSMSVKLKKGGKSLNDTITRTFSPTLDLSDADHFTFWFRVQDENIAFKMKLSDGTDTLTSPIIQNSYRNQWEQKIIEIGDFLDSGSTDLSAISEIQFIVIQEPVTANLKAFFDYLTWGIDPPAVTFKLYDFGRNNNPTSFADGSLITLDNGSTEYILNPSTGVRLYTVHIHKNRNGLSTAIDPNHWYGIRVTSINAKVYGNSSAGSGLFTSSNSTDLVSQANQEMHCIVFTNDNAEGNGSVVIRFNDDPGNGVLRFLVMKEISSNQEEILSTIVESMAVYNQKEIVIENIKFPLAKHTYVKTCYEDDGSSAVTRLDVSFRLNFQEQD